MKTWSAPEHLRLASTGFFGRRVADLPEVEAFSFVEGERRWSPKERKRLRKLLAELERESREQAEKKGAAA